MTPALPSSYFWTWDHSANWVLDDPGIQTDGCYNRYLKQPYTYREDYRRLVDLAAGLGVAGIVIWGFLRDSHGGVESARWVARYAKSRGVAVMPGVGTSWYGGIYYEGRNRYNLQNFLRKHPDAMMLNKQGAPVRCCDDIGACIGHPVYSRWITEAVQWLFREFPIGGVNLENGDFMVDYNPLTVRLRDSLGWPAEDPDVFFHQGASYRMALAAISRRLRSNLCTYATYTGFQPTAEPSQNTGFGDRTPAMFSQLPGDAIAQWTITGMLLKQPLPLADYLDDGAPEQTFKNPDWPEGLRPPARRNVGFMHQGSQWHRSGRYECVVSSIKEACLRAYRSGLEGVSIHGEVSSRHIPSALNYLAFSHFIHWPEDSLAGFGRKTMGQVLGSESEGELFIRTLAYWENGTLAGAERQAADPREHGFTERRVGSADDLQRFRFWQWLRWTIGRERTFPRTTSELMI